MAPKHVCKVCKTRFAAATALRRHAKDKHQEPGIAFYVCAQCGMAKGRTELMRTHLRGCLGKKNHTARGYSSCNPSQHRMLFYGLDPEHGSYGLNSTIRIPKVNISMALGSKELLFHKNHGVVEKEIDEVSDGPSGGESDGEIDGEKANDIDDPSLEQGSASSEDAVDFLSRIDLSPVKQRVCKAVVKRPAEQKNDRAIGVKKVVGLTAKRASQIISDSPSTSQAVSVIAPKKRRLVQKSLEETMIKTVEVKKKKDLEVIGTHEIVSTEKREKKEKEKILMMRELQSQLSAMQAGMVDLAAKMAVIQADAETESVENSSECGGGVGSEDDVNQEIGQLSSDSGVSKVAQVIDCADVTTGRIEEVTRDHVDTHFERQMLAGLKKAAVQLTETGMLPDVRENLGHVHNNIEAEMKFSRGLLAFHSGPQSVLSKHVRRLPFSGKRIPTEADLAKTDDEVVEELPMRMTLSGIMHLNLSIMQPRVVLQDCYGPGDYDTKVPIKVSDVIHSHGDQSEVDKGNQVLLEQKPTGVKKVRKAKKAKKRPRIVVSGTRRANT